MHCDILTYYMLQKKCHVAHILYGFIHKKLVFGLCLFKTQEGMITSMKYIKSCKNCSKGRAITLTGDVLCKYKGVVSADFVCMRHKYIPELKSYKELDYKCIDCANFCIKLDYHDNSPSIGLCKLFSVRQYDGTNKKACSKFLMKPGSRLSQLEKRDTYY
jgi:hypothetical protein